MEKLNRAAKCSILGPQNLGSGGGPGPPWIRGCYIICQGKDCTWRRTTRLVKIDVVNVVHRLARGVDVAKRQLQNMKKKIKKILNRFLGGLSLHLNHLYSIAHDNLRLAIWDTSFWTFLVKFGHKGP